MRRALLLLASLALAGAASCRDRSAEQIEEELRAAGWAPDSELGAHLAWELDRPRTLAEWWRAGGGWMWLIAALGLVALPVAAAQAFAPRGQLLAAGLSLALLVAGAGGLGSWVLRKKVDAAAGHSAQSAFIRQVGYVEARSSYQLGLMLGGLALLGVAIGEVRRRLKAP